MRKTRVRREQHLETRLLGNAQKLSIGQRAPALRVRCSHGMILQRVADGDWRPLVKKNAHLPPGRGDLEAMCGEF